MIIWKGSFFWICTSRIFFVPTKEVVWVVDFFHNCYSHVAYRMSRKVKVRANHLRLIILLNTWFGLYTVVWLDERNAVDDVVSVAVHICIYVNWSWRQWHRVLWVSTHGHAATHFLHFFMLDTCLVTAGGTFPGIKIRKEEVQERYHTDRNHTWVQTLDSTALWVKRGGLVL